MLALVLRGVIVPVLLTIGYLIQGGARAGFWPRHQAISLLSRGPGRWVQTADKGWAAPVTREHN